MVLDVFQTNTAKPHLGGLFHSRPSWDESWTESWKQCRLDEHQLMTVFIFYQLVLQRTALPQCTADMYPGGDECPSAIKWAGGALTLWLLLLLATELTVYSYNDLALGLSSFLLTGRAAATARRLRNGVLLHPFRVKNGAQWNHVTELVGSPPQICTRWPCPPGNCRFIIGRSIITAVTSAQLGWIIEDHWAIWQGRWWPKLWCGAPLRVAPHRAADRERARVYQHTAAPSGLRKKRNAENLQNRCENTSILVTSSTPWSVPVMPWCDHAPNGHTRGFSVQWFKSAKTELGGTVEVATVTVFFGLVCFFLSHHADRLKQELITIFNFFSNGQFTINGQYKCMINSIYILSPY